MSLVGNFGANDNRGAESAKDGVSSVETREEEVHQLARRFTEQSTYSTTVQNPFAADPGSALDPNGDNFNARAWCKAMLRMHTEDNQAHPLRTLGVAFSNLNVHGFSSDADYQKSVGNVWLEILSLARTFIGQRQRKIKILQSLDGLVEAGEMLAVLGPPGSGCSTFLKTIAGETYGLIVDKTSNINYQGVSAKQMANEFRGEAIYTAEVDVHFPKLTVGDTLFFAARARAPRHIPGGATVNQYATHMRDVIMAIFGISHTKNTIVGNDFVRGVSGGERKRVSIAEACLSMAPLQCWDNSTRGLDSANAIEFCKTLRMQTDINDTTACVSLYQAPQAAYDSFDKVLVLYEGRQIYFGRTTTAKQYFLDMGFACPDRQTDADFLTSMTSHLERVVQPGYEARVPRTPDEFAARWKASAERAQLVKDIEAYNAKFALGGEYLDKFKQSRRAQQAKAQRVSSPYILSYVQQVKLCLWRGFKRLKGDPSITISSLVGNSIMALVIASIFYDLKADTNSFFQRSALLFFAVLMNAFGSGLEMLTLYAQRGIVEKHSRYALYHPSAEAFASMLMDLPYKTLNAITYNLVLYFMTNLRREPGAFFFFVFTSFILTLTMSMFFRSIASLTRTLVQALVPAAILILGLSMYTGFTIPTQYMLGWARWIAYINPISYGFESLMINEFHNRDFACVNYVPSGPGYAGIGPNNHVCSTVGSVPGQPYVNGDSYIESSYGYTASHKWRNVGIIFAFMFILMIVYLFATELVTEKKPKGEILVFRRGHKALKKSKSEDDVESGSGRSVVVEKSQSDDIAIIERQTAIFQWKDVCYDIKIGKEHRRILDHVDGWVKPGTLTALMGVSGAGKTTLLDVLATRTTMGVITGEILVDGKPRDESFQRKTGYAQQQDLHLNTSTVREALTFSALLRQPAHVPRQEKIDYVTEVIKLLEMTEYADAIIGVPGDGLNVEQRKRLTIGVELAARPALLLFLDEPTSGLDSQTSWAILDLLDKLKKNGQAILCTIHQPSAILFQRFDRLLFLQAGGRTVYYGDIGENSQILIDYFVRNGGPPCPPAANPAEWMLDVIGAAPGSHTDIDWYDTWRNSPEYRRVQEHLAKLKLESSQQVGLARTLSDQKREDKASYREFAAPFGAQLCEVQTRVFQQIWRSPTYIYSKTALCVSSSLFIGFSLFNTPNTIQGLQNQMFAIFMLLTLFGQLIQQIMPHFVAQRALYEARERLSKTYCWKAFMISNIVVELPWNSLMSVLMFICWYYPIGLNHNAEPTDSVTLRGVQMWLFIWTFLLFSSTFAHFMIAAFETAENAGNTGNLLFMLCLLFCGVLATPNQLPGFWIFMYRVSPFTYLVSGMLSVGISNTEVTCAPNEYLRFDPLNGTCGEYMEAYKATMGGYIENELATSNCNFCPISDTNVFLSSVSANYSDVWRNFGIMWVYIIFNIFAACALYWWVRVPKAKKPVAAKTN
ncbi:multidrug resistance ABC transporter, putative [Coccidioides posadasii C735 delta SOWgp]|uniref:Multidrug resistance ABC transporter, putative n=1 Tax=Coccidioides posadasii (strain C735) TaxID=222929 RepID=C5PCW2_COCP7|nr:multidrug resistance ABC transporter, putative [Coccidioides posadasii C735 delta SOWgp]EER24923.1 multidrug resistance ABC transporter, putative [Coccidioides posadasii C735 delta SOWgp]|eukprot:XP_003067068.1 multidrug resistance ABC transporter, putative [Coccidioides posadasii C735 delta SOWgp]